MEPVFFSEIESFPNALLAHYWPQVPNLGDFTKIDGSQWRGKLDILWSSAPCQAFSAGGKRRGVSDKRGALTLAQIKLVDEINPPIFCFENVKGLLSDKNNAFGQFLGRLAEENGPELIAPRNKWSHSGYVVGPKRRIAWRLLNAQYFGVPQTRERVLVVACPRDGIDPREILLIEGGMSGNAATERAAWAHAATDFERSFGSRGSPKGLGIGTGAEIGRCLTASHSTTRFDAQAETFVLQPQSQNWDMTDVPCRYEFPAYAAALRTRASGPQWELGKPELAHCLRASGGGSDKVFTLAKEGLNWRLRRMMPVEAERLMGMPNDWTNIPFKGKPVADSHRYKSIGNSVCVNMVHWLGVQILDTYSRRESV